VTRIPHRILAWTVVACALAAAAPPAHAQQVGHLTGSVRDPAGMPIKGATVRAANPTNIPNEFTVSSDAKGNWGILGLRAGVWDITASAPGFESSSVPVRVSVLRDNPRVEFVLVGAPPKGALEDVDSKALQADLSSAEGLMASAQWDAAIAAYKAILVKAPPLSTVNLAIGRAMRMKKDYVGAVAAYEDLLRTDPANQHALVELGQAHAERGDLTTAATTLRKAVSINASSDEGKQAAALLGSMKR
jgi:hypothetical protein